MTLSRRLVHSVLGFLALACTGALHAASPVRDLRWSTAQLNPTIGATATISFTLHRHATITARVVDLEGTVARKLVEATRFSPGPRSISWDGRDAAGQVVPDGAYVVSIDAADRGLRSAIAANTVEEAITVPVRYYDRRTGTIAYDLPSAAVVKMVAHAQVDEGLVSKVVASDVARPQGAILEMWDGYDDAGTTYLPSLPGFSIHVEARPLPRNAILVYGAPQTTSHTRIEETVK